MLHFITVITLLFTEKIVCLMNSFIYLGDIASEQYGRDRASTHSFDRQDEYPPPPMVKGVSDPNMSSSKTYKSRKRRLVNPIHTNNVQYRGM